MVMDINMPGMNGIEATRRIKEEMPHVRIIGLSMHDDPEMIQSMHDAGASDFVSKGKPIKQLIEVIHRVQTGTLTETVEGSTDLCSRYPPAAGPSLELGCRGAM